MATGRDSGLSAVKSQWSVEIKNVGSDQIVQHILPLQDLVDEKKSKRKSISADPNKHLKYTTTFSKTDRKSGHCDLGGDSSDVEDELAPLGPDKGTGVDKDDSIEGKSVYKFKSVKKSGQMALKAIDSFSPRLAGRSPKKSLVSPLVAGSPLSPAGSAKTPPRSQRLARKSLDSGQLTPKKSLGMAAVREHKRMEASTPYRLRKRQVQEPQESSGDEDSVDESSEQENDDDDDDDDNENNKEEDSSFLSGSHKTDRINTVASAEAYFDLHAQTPITSDRTLASLQGPRLDVDTVRSVLAGLASDHVKHRRTLMDNHARLFNKWMLHMCSGFNVLLHGLGSKRDLLEQFTQTHLTKFSHLVVNGYFPSLTVKHILNSITEDLLGNSKGFTNPQAQLDFIKKEYKNRDEDIFLVIHNIDGVLIRSEKSQAVLSLLAEVDGFHIIASLDHINAGFMWDQTKYFRFRWLWYETPTFAHYEAENSYENSLLVQQSGGLALSSLSHVMRSLTPNARQIFLVLAEYQVENGDSANYAGMSFQVLYHRCREAFLVNSDLTLQAQLVEFKDHRLLKAKKNFEGIEHLSIPIDLNTLKEFLQDYKGSS